MSDVCRYCILSPLRILFETAFRRMSRSQSFGRVLKAQLSGTMCCSFLKPVVKHLGDSPMQMLLIHRVVEGLCNTSAGPDRDNEVGGLLPLHSIHSALFRVEATSSASSLSGPR
jgi:hypothetical protein